MNDSTRADWLTEPRSRIFLDPLGRPEGAYIEFRTGKTSRVERTSPSALVFMCFGADDLPMGVRMVGPAPELVQSSIIYRLLASRNGGTSVDVPISFIDSAIHQLQSASASLRRTAAASLPT